jgi:HTH-type transcriptional regulator/antitoxin HigA
MVSPVMYAQMKTEFEPDLLYHPGEHIQDLLDEKQMSQSHLALRLGMTPKAVNELIQGKTSLTPAMAQRLENVFRVPAHFWNNLALQYQEYLQRNEEAEILKSYINWVKEFPILAMRKMGVLSSGRGVNLLTVKEILQFFGVSGPKEWDKVQSSLHPQLEFKKNANSNYKAIAVWLRLGELAAEAIYCSDFDEKQLRTALPLMRQLTQKKMTPDVFLQLQRLCAKAGIALVLVSEISGAQVCGVTRWLSPKKALVQLSLRYKTADHFWFAFFHELGHILLHGKKETFLEGSHLPKTEKEDQADAFAAELLVPPKAFGVFKVQQPKPSQQAIEEFAAQIGAHPAIVLGQLQFQGVLPWDRFRHLKQCLTTSDLEA